MDFHDDQAMLAKDAVIRRRYLKWFNKRRTDFDSDRAYDDYLEMVEETIHKVVHGIDVAGTRATVEAYKRANRDAIAANQALRVDEERAAAEAVAQAGRDRVARLAAVRAEDEARERAVERDRRVAEAEELVRAAHGEDAYRRVVRKREKRERKERRESEAAAMPAVEDTAPAFFRPAFPSAQPSVVPSDKPPAKAGTRHVPLDASEEAEAGGFSQELVQERALREFEESFALLLDLE